MAYVDALTKSSKVFTENRKASRARQRINDILEKMSPKAEGMAKALEKQISHSFSLKPEFTHTTIGNQQFIHSNAEECPICGKREAHDHIGYNGTDRAENDERITWDDPMVTDGEFIVFHRGGSDAKAISSIPRRPPPGTRAREKWDASIASVPKGCNPHVSAARSGFISGRFAK